MNVLFIAGWFPQGNNHKGIFVKEHALAVAKMHRVVVIHGEEDTRQGERFLFSETVEDGLQILRFTYAEIPFFSSFRRYVKGVLISFDRLAKQGFIPDIVHANVYFTGVPANIIRRKYGIPYVITEHYTGFPRRSMRRSKVKQARIGMGGAEYILPVSNSLKEAIIAHGITGRFEVIPNVVSNVFYYAPEVRNRSEIKQVLCVSAMHPKKNIPNLIDACEILHSKRKDFVVNVVGTGKKMREYTEAVERKSLTGTIRFTGSKNKSEISAMMQSSDFFVLPSRYETFGCVIAESMACGLPVIATRVGGVPEIIDKTNGILVESDNPQALSEGMDFMMDNPGIFDRRSISENACRKYSAETVAKQIDSIYKRLLESHK